MDQDSGLSQPSLTVMTEQQEHCALMPGDLRGGGGCDAPDMLLPR